MNINNFTKKELEELLTFITVLLADILIFRGADPSNMVNFAVKDEINFLGRSTDGMLSMQVISKCRFDWKYWFELLDKEGVLEIDDDFRILSFCDWKIKTNMQSLLNLKNTIREALEIKNRECSANLIEMGIRDAISNNPTLKYPAAPNNITLINGKDLIIKREYIDECGECDIVCRLNGEIKYIVEVTSGSITNSYPEKRVPKRKEAVPDAIIWVIGARMNNGEILSKLVKEGVYVTKFSQLKSMYPKVFDFL